MQYEEWARRLAEIKIENLAKLSCSREEKLLMCLSMIAVINSLTQGKAVVKRAYREILWGVLWDALEGRVEPWREVNKDLGRFFLTTTRGRGPKKKDEFTKRVRALKAAFGRGSVEKIAKSLNRSKGSIRYHLYGKNSANK
jgi:hypothetical protein